MAFLMVMTLGQVFMGVGGAILIQVRMIYLASSPWGDVMSREAAGPFTKFFTS